MKELIYLANASIGVVSTNSHARLGEGVWNYSGVDIEIEFYSLGIKLVSHCIDIELLFSGITEIKSELTVMAYSEASTSGNFEKQLKIGIKTGSSFVNSLIPVKIYSAVLSALVTQTQNRATVFKG
jgi:hypothetical protein